MPITLTKKEARATEKTYKIFIEHKLKTDSIRKVLNKLHAITELLEERRSRCE